MDSHLRWIYPALRRRLGLAEELQGVWEVVCPRPRSAITLQVRTSKPVRLVAGHAQKGMMDALSRPMEASPRRLFVPGLTGSGSECNVNL